MGAAGINGAEVRGSVCGFPAAGRKKTGNTAEGWVLEIGDRKTVLQGAGTQPLRTYVDRGQAILADWVELRPIFDV